ncbi:MAG: type II toxin-antitoxin system RelE/ParE family toxin [Acidaminococcaceae bacterium]
MKREGKGLFMEIRYKKKELKNICENYKKVKKEFGADVAEKLFSAIDFIEAAPSIADVKNYPPFHFHPLQGNKKGEYAIDLGRKLGFRLILKPLNSDGTFSNNEQIYSAKAIEIVVILLEEVSNHYD